MRKFRNSMNLTRALFKSFLLSSVVVLYLIVAFTIHLVTRDISKRRRRFTRMVSWACGAGLKILNIQVKAINLEVVKNRTHLLVGNHLGFLDILITAKTLPTLFVTSYELKETPVLGLLTEMSGCLYVERRSRENIPNEIKNITRVLNEGFNIVLYPEGTSGDGQKVLPFKKSMLTAAAHSEANILPMCLNYVRVNGEPMSDKYRDSLFWYGDMGFLTSAWRMVQLHSIEVELVFLDEVVVNPLADRREVAANVQAQIERYYIKIPRPGSFHRESDLHSQTRG